MMLKIIVKHTDDVTEMLKVIVKHTDDVRDYSKTY